MAKRQVEDRSVVIDLDLKDCQWLSDRTQNTYILVQILHSVCRRSSLMDSLSDLTLVVDCSSR